MTNDEGGQLRSSTFPVRLVSAFRYSIFNKSNDG